MKGKLAYLSPEQVLKKPLDPRSDIYSLGVVFFHAATGQLLDHGKGPSPRTGELDNRGSHFYLALYWAEALAAQSKDAELKAKFAKIAGDLTANEAKINEDLLAAQGSPVDMGGYYHPNDAKTSLAMRPSATLNAIIDAI